MQTDCLRHLNALQVSVESIKRWKKEGLEVRNGCVGLLALLLGGCLALEKPLEEEKSLFRSCLQHTETAC